MTNNAKKLTLLGLAAILAPAILVGVARSSDHADTPEIAANPGRDISDVYIFPSKEDSKKVVLAMNVRPLIGAGAGMTTYFDPNTLYQFKIDTDSDGVEDKVIQAKFGPAGPGQTVSITAPIKPSTTGTINKMETPLETTGVINQTFSPMADMKVFAGGREDSFYFDLEQFFNIFPDRATPLTGTVIAEPNKPMAAGWRAKGVAKDFLSTGNYNVLSIVIELPRSVLQ